MKSKKYIVVLGVLLAAGLLLLGLPAQAAQTVAQGSCGDGLTWTLDDTGLLTISGTGAMANYGPQKDPSAAGDQAATGTAPLDPAPWQVHRDKITAVGFSEGITHIGSYAFQNCDKLIQVTLPNTLTAIGEGAFSGCAALEKLPLNPLPNPENTTDPETTAPETTDPEPTAPETTVPETTVTEPTPIPPQENILPTGLTSIGASAFSGCVKLKDIGLPEGLLKLEANTFSGCSILRQITLPVSLTTVEANAFAGCNRLKLVHYAGEAQQWNAITLADGNLELTRARKESLCDHTWGPAAITKEATCGAEGELTYTCPVCSGTREETIPITAPHTLSNYVKIDKETHKCSCTVCFAEFTTEHTWDSGIVVRNVSCGETGLTHYTCTGCRTTKNVTTPKWPSHTYDSVCDATCNVCSTVRRVYHEYPDNWESDNESHWKTCKVCQHMGEIGVHTWGEDEHCTTCGLKNPHEHVYDTQWAWDENTHWHACACGKKTEESPHTYDEDYLCTDCGIEDPNKPQPTEPPTIPTDPPVEQKTTAMDLPVILAMGLMAVSGMGLVVFLIIKKKTPT